MKRCIIFYWLVFCFSITCTFAQDPEIDSLNQLIKNSGEDTIKANALVMLSKKYTNAQPEDAIKYALQAKLLSQKLSFRHGQALALKYIGLAYIKEGKYQEAIIAYRQSLGFFQQLHDENGMANLYNNIGVVFNEQGDDENALTNYLKSLQYAEQIGNKLRMATVLQNIGNLYLNKKNTHDQALEYFLKSLKLGQEEDYKDVLGAVTVNLGEIYMERNQDDSALFYFRISLDALKSIPDTGSIPYTYNDIGNVYTKKKDYKTAIYYHGLALNMSKAANAQLDMVISLLGLADTYYESGDIHTALQYYIQAEPIAKDLNSYLYMKISYQGLALSYSKLKDYKNAFKYQDLLTSTQDSIYNTETDKKLAKLEYNFNIQKKEVEINLLTKDKDLQDLNLKRQKTVRNSLAAGLALLMIIAFIIYGNYRSKVKTNKILDSQKAEIEGLLLNILPAEVAHELQRTGKATPQYYQNVSVLFSDFKGFTSLADGLSPQELVFELNAHFNAFDNIMEKYNLEKIKTIGDSYMCAGGIPIQDETHPLKMIYAALEMQEYIKLSNQKRMETDLLPWELRIGIHTGPLVAGVVGRKKYAYDIWGTTVNIASRMESNGESGLVNISAATYELIKHEYECMYRGKIYAKNIGEIDMYLVERKISNTLQLAQKLPAFNQLTT